ncbi:hypothetical protein GXP67_06575 [Rhodocytophaga rosea]|uniref:Uncharacterized protein n=1 Tax=Rhodocytophaga rosea TaxID=2704465 RepID=A0A6C0GED7_9BACT|nr:hypothetical protein [Rhodocytophaga rosea]QHT66345.1 hypothetical protein GXP67_06575 [Rhodocytophaga rosea]
MRLERNIPYWDLTSEAILSAISSELKRQKISDIEIKGNVLSFKRAFFSGSAKVDHLMTPIDEGYFSVELDKQRLVYDYSTKRMMWTMLAMGLFTAIVSDKLIMSIVGFSGIFGMHWVTAFFKHRLFMQKLIEKIIPEHNAKLKPPTGAPQLIGSTQHTVCGSF